MTDFANLPTLVLNEIFNYMNCNDRIRCKLVCKRWRQEIESRDQKCLVIRCFKRLNEPFYHDKQLIKIENNLIFQSVDVLFRFGFKQQFKNIKKICLIDHPIIKQFHNTEFERFIKIFNQIEYFQFFDFSFSSKLSIDLPQLKNLILFGQCTKLISFNCPSLINLTVSSIKNIKINLNKLKKLKFFYFRDYNKFEPNIKLNQLECLVIFNDVNQLDDRLLNCYPGLKRLICYTSDARRDLIKLNEQKKRYGLKDLNILINGFEISNDLNTELKIIQGIFYFWDKQSIETIFNGYTKLTHQLDNAFFDYNLLIEKFKILPNDFFDKFEKISRIKIGSVKNYIHLREFLKSIPTLHSIQLFNLTELDNEFLDQIYLLTPSICSILLEEECSSRARNYDLTFLLNLNIMGLYFMSDLLPVDLIRKAIKYCKDLQMFCYTSQTMHFKIFFYSYFMMIRLPDHPPETFENLNSLIDYLQSNHHYRHNVI